MREDAEPTLPKSILKHTKKSEPKSPKHSGPRSISPSYRISKAVEEKLAEEDEVIADLEKKLGLKGKKKLHQSLRDDGLDELLEGLDEEEDLELQQEKNAKAEGDDWLQRKRIQARKLGQLEAREARIAKEEGEEDDEEEIDR